MEWWIRISLFGFVRTFQRNSMLLPCRKRFLENNTINVGNKKKVQEIVQRLWKTD